MADGTKALLEKIAELRAISGTDPTLYDLAAAAKRPSGDVDREVQVLVARGLVEGIQMIGSTGFTAIRLTRTGAQAISNPTYEDDSVTIRIVGDGNQVAVAQKSQGTFQSAKQGSHRGLIHKIIGWVLAHKLAVGVILIVAFGGGYFVFRYG